MSNAGDDRIVPGDVLGVPAAHRQVIVRTARAELRSGRTGAAIEMLRAATWLDPLDRPAWELLRQAHERAGQVDDADEIKSLLDEWEQQWEVHDAG